MKYKNIFILILLFAYSISLYANNYDIKYTKCILSNDQTIRVIFETEDKEIIKNICENQINIDNLFSIQYPFPVKSINKNHTPYDIIFYNKDNTKFHYEESCQLNNMINVGSYTGEFKMGDTIHEKLNFSVISIDFASPNFIYTNNKKELTEKRDLSLIIKPENKTDYSGNKYPEHTSEYVILKGQPIPLSLKITPYSEDIGRNLKILFPENTHIYDNLMKETDKKEYYVHELKDKTFYIYTNNTNFSSLISYSDPITNFYSEKNINYHINFTTESITNSNKIIMGNNNSINFGEVNPPELFFNNTEVEKIEYENDNIEINTNMSEYNNIPIEEKRNMPQFFTLSAKGKTPGSTKVTFICKDKTYSLVFNYFKIHIEDLDIQSGDQNVKAINLNIDGPLKYAKDCILEFSNTNNLYLCSDGKCSKMAKKRYVIGRDELPNELYIKKNSNKGKYELTVSIYSPLGETITSNKLEF